MWDWQAKTTEDYGDSTIKCPVCGEVAFTDLWEFSTHADEEVVQVECGECGEPLLLKIDVSISYQLQRDPGKPTSRQEKDGE